MSDINEQARGFFTNGGGAGPLLPRAPMTDLRARCEAWLNEECAIIRWSEKDLDIFTAFVSSEVASAVAGEREECAKVALDRTVGPADVDAYCREQISCAIRARSSAAPGGSK